MSGNVSSEQEKQLTPKQELFIAARIAGNSIITSAKAAGISEKTAHVWLKEPHIKSALKAAQREVYDRAIDNLMLLVEDASNTLKELMHSEDVRPYVRAQCASILLDKGIDSHSLSELEAKLAQLEEALHDQQHK